jgi:hypothetical protein|tara:strand:- start:1268 stop:1957 length:690 start_codon:yes stop_codon:yes gene_type:complete
MPTTFIDLTNTLLRRLNEVELAEADFVGARGVQALAKDAIRASIAKINSAEFEWPFNAAENSQVLIPGVEEYSWPDFFKSTEWNSFQIQKDDSLNTNTKALRFIERDYYYRSFRSADQDAGNLGLSMPDYVFPSHGNGYGVSPSPDKAYTIKFRYFITHSNLQATTDQTRVPTIYDHVVIDGGMYHMYMFRDNTEAANVAMSQYMMGIKEMQTVLINKYQNVLDTRVNF